MVYLCLPGKRRAAQPPARDPPPTTAEGIGRDDHTRWGEGWSGAVSNRRPSAFQADALPTELPDRENKGGGVRITPPPLLGDPDGTRTRDLRRDRAAR